MHLLLHASGVARVMETVLILYQEGKPWDSMFGSVYTTWKYLTRETMCLLIMPVVKLVVLRHSSHPGKIVEPILKIRCKSSRLSPVFYSHYVLDSQSISIAPLQSLSWLRHRTSSVIWCALDACSNFFFLHQPALKPQIILLFNYQWFAWGGGHLRDINNELNVHLICFMNSKTDIIWACCKRVLSGFTASYWVVEHEISQTTIPRKLYWPLNQFAAIISRFPTAMWYPQIGRKLISREVSQAATQRKLTTRMISTVRLWLGSYL